MQQRSAAAPKTLQEFRSPWSQTETTFALQYWAFCSFLKKEQPPNQNHLYLDVFTGSLLLFFSFFWQNYKGSNRKKCINYFPIQLLWKQWLAWSCTIFHIGVLLRFMEKGSGYPQLFRNLSLCKQSLSPPKSPPAAHVHIKTVDRIPPGNFFHQHSFHGDREVVLRDSSYTLRWQSWTFTNFKELHRVFQLETKAPPKK